MEQSNVISIFKHLQDIDEVGFRLPSSSGNPVNLASQQGWDIRQDSEKPLKKPFLNHAEKFF
jgi:hypothetical protein